MATKNIINERVITNRPSKPKAKPRRKPRRKSKGKPKTIGDELQILKTK